MLNKTDRTSTFSNAASHILRATVEPDRPIRVRRNQILAESGAIALSADHDSNKTDRDSRDAGTNDKAKSRKGAEAERAGQIANAGKMKAHLATGTGEMYMGRNGGDISVFSIDDDRVVLFAQAEVLAFDESLALTLEQTHEKAAAAVLGTKFAWVLEGTGHFATATSGETVVLEVAPDRPLRVETEAVLARTEGIKLSKAHDSDRSTVKRGAKQVLNVVPGVNVSLGRQRVWLNAEGAGQLIIRSSD